jgi:DNA-binding HxlR family transcriptional regulator
MVDPAELFEAISHPARIKILKTLKKKPSSFASLKRQLDIDSSGNLDYHLKKLGQLVTVREDGLYGLTDAGNEALLSIEAVEMWTETKKRKIRMASKMPKEAFLLALLELCTTVSILWYFFAIAQVTSFWGYLVSIVMLLLGAYSTFGILTQQKWGWESVLVKSALVMLMTIFLLYYLTQPDNFAQPASAAVSFGIFVAAETAAAILALRHPLKDFLGIKNEVRQPFHAIVGSLLGMFSGIFLIILESMQHLGNGASTVFNSSINDTTILTGLAIGIGGILIMLRSYALGGVLSIVFGLYPPPQFGLHAYDLISGNAFLGPFAISMAVLAGSLPIVGGILAFLSVRGIWD